MAQIFPSLMAAPLLHLHKVMSEFDPFVAGYHIDVMDFHFVPNLTWGPDMVNAIARATDRPLMVHLMVEYPERMIERLSLKKGSLISIHSESISEYTPQELIASIKAQGLCASLAISPDTAIDKVPFELFPVEHFLLMAVQPGFSGQEFMPEVYEKLIQLKNVDRSFIVAIDGGVNLTNGAQLLLKGADQLVVGSAIFGAPDPLQTVIDISHL